MSVSVHGVQAFEVTDLLSILSIRRDSAVPPVTPETSETRPKFAKLLANGIFS